MKNKLYRDKHIGGVDVTGDPAGLQRATATEDGVNNYTIILVATSIRMCLQLLSYTKDLITKEKYVQIDYALWDVVKYESFLYTLMSLDDFDNNSNPLESENWGAIADYTPEHNEYELSEHEYVVYNGKVFYPETDVNADIPEIGKNLSLHDPRHFNLKKHLLCLAVYELTKLIAPNNVSVVRVKDYEDSMKWLSDAAKLKLNPQIPRKLAEDNKPVTDWQMATFQMDYDPYKNPWLT